MTDLERFLSKAIFPVVKRKAVLEEYDGCIGSETYYFFSNEWEDRTGKKITAVNNGAKKSTINKSCERVFQTLEETRFELILP